jgi:hypothetical protein
MLAEAHSVHKDNYAVKQELDFAYRYLNENDFKYQEDTVNFVLVNGSYKHIERKLKTMCLLVNKTGREITDFKARLVLKFKETDAKIAVANIDFDNKFMGNLPHNTALLFHLNFPVKGLDTDGEYTVKQLTGGMTDINYLFKKEGGEIVSE